MILDYQYGWWAFIFTFSNKTAIGWSWNCLPSDPPECTPCVWLGSCWSILGFLCFVDHSFFFNPFWPSLRFLIDPSESSDYSYLVKTSSTDTPTLELNLPTFGWCLHILIFKLCIGMSIWNGNKSDTQAYLEIHLNPILLKKEKHVLYTNSCLNVFFNGVLI